MNETKDPDLPDRNHIRVIPLPLRNEPGHSGRKEKYLEVLLHFNMLEDIDHLLEEHFSKPKR